LRTENPAGPLYSYVSELYLYNETRVSESTISRWFQNRFDYRGSFRKPNMVPLDKYWLVNIARYLEFMHKKEVISDHRRFNFLDEKHIVNKDTVPNKVRACPLTGRIDSIQVSGDFREAYSIIALISADPSKPKPVVYTIGKKNGDANSFLLFIELLISSGYLRHKDVLIMDNASIHTGGPARIVENLLWNHLKDGLPLRILVVYLPTRSPELNPIELIFHILARRSRDWRLYRNFAGRAIVSNASKVMDEMSYELIRRCCVHCSYYL
jgi:DDE superfamily endonuclease